MGFYYRDNCLRSHSAMLEIDGRNGSFMGMRMGLGQLVAFVLGSCEVMDLILFAYLIPGVFMMVFLDGRLDGNGLWMD